eukprot:6294570-Alexandrium_andersonii.AAC.1
MGWDPVFADSQDATGAAARCMEAYAPWVAKRSTIETQPITPRALWQAFRRALANAPGLDV